MRVFVISLITLATTLIAWPQTAEAHSGCAAGLAPAATPSTALQCVDGFQVCSRECAPANLCSDEHATAKECLSAHAPAQQCDSARDPAKRYYSARYPAKRYYRAPAPAKQCLSARAPAHQDRGECWQTSASAAPHNAVDRYTAWLGLGQLDRAPARPWRAAR